MNKINFNQPKSELQAFTSTIKQYFEKNPPLSISEAAAKIDVLSGIKQGETQVLKFLKDKGFRFIRVGMVSAEALTEKKNE